MQRCNNILEKVRDSLASLNVNTLNSVGTISLGVSKPTHISRPTKDMIDMKMAKSLISFLSYQTHRQQDSQD